MTSKRSVHAKYMWLMCARPPGAMVARAHRGAAFMRRRATRSSLADENRRAHRSTVTSLVWTPSQSESKRRSDGDDVAVVRLDQLPAPFVDHPVMAATEQDLVLDLAAAAVQPVHHMMAVAMGGGALAAGPPAVFVGGDRRSPPRPLARRLRPADVD